MNKFVFFLLIAVSLFISLELDSKTAAHENQSAFIKLTAISTPKPLAEIEKIELDRDEVIYICPFSQIDQSSSVCGKDENLSIKVKTIVRNPENKLLTYEYTVSGGRIVGQGDQVSWDLKGVRPGAYKIMVAIKGDRKVSSQTKTLSATVSMCPCEPVCICPSLSVSGSKEVKASETVTFTANLSGGIDPDIKYNWTVSQGEIIEGQGTPNIKVKTNQEMSGTIRATVEIGSSNLCPDCPRTASETATITK